MSNDILEVPSVMNMRFASVYTNSSEQRLRAEAREGKIPGANKDESTGAWLFTKEGLDQWQAEKQANGRTGRVSPNGKAFVIHVKPEQLTDVREALGALDIELEPRYNYAKQREYQARRKAEKLAAADADAD